MSGISRSRSGGRSARRSFRMAHDFKTLLVYEVIDGANVERIDDAYQIEPADKGCLVCLQGAPVLCA